MMKVETRNGGKELSNFFADMLEEFSKAIKEGRDPSAIIDLGSDIELEIRLIKAGDYERVQTSMSVEELADRLINYDE